MPRINRLFYPILMLFLFSASALLPGNAKADSCEKTVTIRLSDNYPPYAVERGEGNFEGIDAVMVRRIMEHAGCHYRLQSIPWKRALIDLAEGNVDIMATASRSGDREVFARFSLPYRDEQIRLFSRAGDARFADMESLDDLLARGLVIGHQSGTWRGAAFGEFLAAHPASPLIRKMTDPANALALVARGRLDAYVEDVAAAHAYIRSKGLDGRLEAVAWPLYDAPIHLMYSRKSVSEALARRLDNAIASVLAEQEAGKLQEAGPGS